MIIHRGLSSCPVRLPQRQLRYAIITLSTFDWSMKISAIIFLDNHLKMFQQIV